MTENDRYAHVEIGQLLSRFFQALDEQRYDDQVALVADGGTWLRQGKLLTGPDGIRSAMIERPVDFHTVHLISNLIVDQSGTEAGATFVGTAMAHQGEIPEGEPAPVSIAQVARYHATFVDTGKGWRIQSLRSGLLFKAL